MDARYGFITSIDAGRGIRVADDVQVQGDVTITGSARARTLHLKNLRKQWQIITLQVIATAALVGMYLEVVSTLRSWNDRPYNSVFVY